MRFLMMVASLVLMQLHSTVIAAVAPGETFVSLGQLQLNNPLNAELAKEKPGEAPATHLVVLGSLKKVNHVLEPEASKFVIGTKSKWTYKLEDARSTTSIAEFYRSQLTALGTILFECSGRGCGSSSYWANKIFKEAVIYGPEQFQRYFITEISSGYVMVYVAQRATRDIYVHIEYLGSSSP